MEEQDLGMLHAKIKAAAILAQGFEGSLAGELKKEWRDAVSQKRDAYSFNPRLRQVLKTTKEFGFTPTNWGPHPVSQHDPAVKAGERYRPLVANPAPAYAESPFVKVQRFIFDRITSRLRGTFIFPAAGQDAALLRNANYLIVQPVPEKQKFQTIPGGSVYHLEKGVEQLEAEDVERARETLHSPKNSVLILKGAQQMLSAERLRELIRKTNPSHVIIMGSAAHGFLENAVGFPSIKDEHVRAIEGAGFQNATSHFFSPEEMGKLREIHELGERHFAWQGGHFPATQVKVFERMGAQRF